ncbi:MAG: helix-turn-helix transcriptional regulator [Eubacterium sp.]
MPKEWFENLGESYLAYFRRKRMEKAAELLEATTLKVIEIATAVGYENQGKFAKVFSEVYGMTPLEYRRWAR